MVRSDACGGVGWMWESQWLELGLEVGKGKEKHKSLRTFEIRGPLLGRGLGGGPGKIYMWPERRWFGGAVSACWTRGGCSCGWEVICFGSVCGWHLAGGGWSGAEEAPRGAVSDVCAARGGDMEFNEGFAEPRGCEGPGVLRPGAAMEQLGQTVTCFAGGPEDDTGTRAWCRQPQEYHVPLSYTGFLALLLPQCLSGSLTFTLLLKMKGDN